MKIAVVLAEFGKTVPDVAQYRECWPEADIQLFTDLDVERIPQFEGPRYGWRANDYWTIRKALCILEDKAADVVVAVDGDMRIVNFPKMRTLPCLAENFGICMPMNPRYTVERDFTDGADVSGTADQFTWTGPSVNCSPIAISSSQISALVLAREYLHKMLGNPVRGPIAWWRAMMATGIAPLILPPQWCVCERHIGVGGEIMLHEGHESVKRHYAGIEVVR